MREGRRSPLFCVSLYVSLAQAMAQRTARRQPFRRAVRSSWETEGTKVRSQTQLRRISSRSFQKPEASPADRPPQGGGLDAPGPLDAQARQVRLELHEEAVGGGAAVYLKGGQGQARLLFHSCQQVVGLIGQGFRHRTDQVLPGNAPGQSHHGAPA